MVASIVQQARLAVRAVRSGDRLRDKLGIVGRLGVYLLFPIGSLARRVGHPVPDPAAAFGELRVRGSAGTFVCPPGPAPYFLALDASYEPGLQRLLEEVETGSVIDIGANIGFIAVRAGRRLEGAGDVVAFEPHPVRFAYLQRNIALNGISNVRCVNCALGDEDGEVTLYDVDPTLGPRHLDVSLAAGRGQTYRVPLRRLDDVLDELSLDADIALVKIDVEGAELGVLRGMPRLLARRPRLVIEVLDGDRGLASVRQLLPTGYSAREIDPNNFLFEAEAP